MISSSVGQGFDPAGGWRALVGQRYRVTIHRLPSVVLAAGDLNAGHRWVAKVSDDLIVFRYQDAHPGGNDNAGWVMRKDLRDTETGFEVWIGGERTTTYTLDEESPDGA